MGCSAFALALVAASLASVPPSIADGRRGARLLQQSPEEEPPPEPPLVNAPDTPPPQEAPAEVEPQREPPPRARSAREQVPSGDPHSNSASLVEVAAGAGGVFAADLVAVAILIGVVIGSSGGDPTLTAVGIVLGALLATVVDIVLVPFGAALGAWLAADKNAPNKGFGGALGGAWLAQLGWIAAVGVVSLASGGAPLEGPGGALVQGLLVLLHYVGVPLGASLGLHRGTPLRVYGSAPPSRMYPARLATRPHEFHAAGSPKIASSVLALSF